MTINDRNFLQRGHLDATPAFSAFPNTIPSRKDRDPSQTVLVGDCLDLLRKIEANSIDAVVTSPPYNIGIRYRTYHDSKPRSEYMEWMEEIASQITRVLADDGSVFINLGAGPDPWISSDVAAEFRKHLMLQNRISWVKNISIGEKSIGHFKPVNSPRYLNRTHEEIFHFTKRGDVKIDRLAVGVPYQDKSNIDRWRHARSDRRCAGNSWYIPYETVRSRGGKLNHPATFPVGLPLRCLRLHGKTGVVLDPFAGSGTTLVAAQILGWHGIGIEIDEVYADLADARLAELRNP